MQKKAKKEGKISQGGFFGRDRDFSEKIPKARENEKIKVLKDSPKEKRNIVMKRGD